MCFHVCKFGGSSLADAACFARVKAIVESDSRRRYIVLSAPGRSLDADEKITDLLYALLRASSDNHQYIFSRIRDRYAQIAQNLHISSDDDRLLDCLHHPSARDTDYIVSRGEYICARLFSAYSGIPFVDAADLIRLNMDGSVDYSASRTAVEKHLLPLPRAVIPGFYGQSAQGGIRTFSRGGSDITGALISALTGAKLYENWTDVDGLYTADPQLIEGVERHLCLSYGQMRQIALAGAKVLHPDCLAPLNGTGIDTLLKNTFHPCSQGTLLSDRCTNTVFCVTGRTHADESAASAVISVFGASPSTIDDALLPFRATHTIHMKEYSKIIIAQEQFLSALRAVHAHCIEKTRIPN